jgi:hypothetical protein
VAAGRVGEGGELSAFSSAEWGGQKADWKKFWKEALHNAAEDFKQVEIRFHRDANRVIRYAEVQSRQGRMAAVVLAPEFARHFVDTMGESFLIAVPNRYQCFVFPKLAWDVSRYAPLVQEAYRATAYPVSTELFECETGGVWAVGMFERP